MNLEKDVFRRFFKESELRDPADRRLAETCVRKLVRMFSSLQPLSSPCEWEDWAVEVVNILGQRLPMRCLSFRVNERAEDRKDQFRSLLTKEWPIVARLAEEGHLVVKGVGIEEERRAKVLDFGGGNGWFGALAAVFVAKRFGLAEVDVYVVEPEAGTEKLASEFGETAQEGQEWVREWIREQQMDHCIHLFYIQWNGICVVELATDSVDLVVFRVSLHHMESGCTRPRAMDEAFRVMRPDGQLWIKEHDGARRDQQLHADLFHFLYLLQRWTRQMRQGGFGGNDLELRAEVAHYMDYSGRNYYLGGLEWKEEWASISEGRLKCVGTYDRYGGRSQDPHNYSHLFWQVYEEVFETEAWSATQRKAKEQEIVQRIQRKCQARALAQQYQQQPRRRQHGLK